MAIKLDLLAQKTECHEIKSAALLVMFLCLLLTAPDAWAQKQEKKSSKCVDSAQTQSDLNNSAGKDSANAERELNATYQGILKKYADDPAFIGRLRTAQRAWLKFRDAQLQMRFPPSNQAGSVAPMCYASYKAELTQARTRELKVWLDGIEEGDVCAGSVKIR
jgi:uncharacterized protein YecT (DUF1311 family)